MSILQRPAQAVEHARRRTPDVAPFVRDRQVVAVAPPEVVLAAQIVLRHQEMAQRDQAEDREDYRVEAVQEIHHMQIRLLQLTSLE